MEFHPFPYLEPENPTAFEDTAVRNGGNLASEDRFEDIGIGTFVADEGFVDLSHVCPGSCIVRNRDIKARDGTNGRQDQRIRVFDSGWSRSRSLLCILLPAGK